MLFWYSYAFCFAGSERNFWFTIGIQLNLESHIEMALKWIWRNHGIIHSCIYIRNFTFHRNFSLICGKLDTRYRWKNTHHTYVFLLKTFLPRISLLWLLAEILFFLTSMYQIGFTKACIAWQLLMSALGSFLCFPELAYCVRIYDWTLRSSYFTQTHVPRPYNVHVGAHSCRILLPWNFILSNNNTCYKHIVCSLCAHK